MDIHIDRICMGIDRMHSADLTTREIRVPGGVINEITTHKSETDVVWTVKSSHPVQICFQNGVTHGCIGAVIIAQYVDKDPDHEWVGTQVFSLLVVKLK